MYIAPCPCCGRLPKIEECMPVKKYKHGIRRRMCLCPNYCSIIPENDHLNHFYFMFEGEGDVNDIYKLWNKAIQRFNANTKVHWYERD